MEINYEEIKQYVNLNNMLAYGKEVNVYNYENEVIKIFHNKRMSSLDKITDEGLKKLIELPLKSFNKPKKIITLNGKIIGYIEDKLNSYDFNYDKENLNYEEIKEDIILLGNSGFTIQDLFYNYTINDNKIIFFDLTSYKYVKTDVPFLKEKFVDSNLEIMNNFLIGLIEYNAFNPKSQYEFTKIYLANKYRLEYCKDKYYGDLIKQKNKNK